MANVDCVLKLVLVGDSSTGKTTLVHRYVDGKFTPNYTPSIGVDFMYKNIEVDNKKVRLQVWDTAGQERFSSLSSAFCRGAEGIILVYDITNQRSFESISRWLTSVSKYCTDSVVKILVANKCDMEDRRVVRVSEGRKLADDLGIPFIEASAVKNTGISEIFESITKRIVQNEHVKASSPDASLSKKKSCMC